MRTTLTSLLLLFLAASVSSAQDLDWKKLVERGQYTELADKLEPYLDSSKADEKLRFYLDATLGYLRRGAKAKISGSEIVLVRGAKNDRLYQMPQASGRKRRDNHEGLFAEPHLYPSGGPRLFVPNRIRYMRRSWDDRLPAYQDYFTEATDLLGGNGSALQELEKIIEHHKGGGLGTSANSVKSVLISTSTRPLTLFGPPFYIMKIAPERCIFNWKGLSGEFEVLVPFFILPHEIVARCDTYEEVINHPAYQQSALKDVPFREGGWSGPNNWETIEQNIRAGRTALPLDPADEPVEEGTLAGKLSTSGRSVYLEVEGERLKLSPSAVASTLSRFAGLEARVKGEREGDTIAVEEILSPSELTSLSGTADGDELVLDDGSRLATYGATARALPASEGSVSLRGYVFSDAQGQQTGVYVQYMKAKLAETLTLSRPLPTKAPAGTPVEIRYVYSTGKRAIVRAADGAWGYVDVSSLTIGKPTVGLAGAVNTGN